MANLEYTNGLEQRFEVNLRYDPTLNEESLEIKTSHIEASFDVNNKEIEYRIGYTFKFYTPLSNPRFDSVGKLLRVEHSEDGVLQGIIRLRPTNYADNSITITGEIAKEFLQMGQRDYFLRHVNRGYAAAIDAMHTMQEKGRTHEKLFTMLTKTKDYFRTNQDGKRRMFEQFPLITMPNTRKI